MDQTQLLPAIASEVATLMMLLIEEEEEDNQQEIERRCWMTDIFLERESVWSRLFGFVQLLFWCVCRCSSGFSIFPGRPVVFRQALLQFLAKPDGVYRGFYTAARNPSTDMDMFQPAGSGAIPFPLLVLAKNKGIIGQ